MNTFFWLVILYKTWVVLFNVHWKDTQEKGKEKKKNTYTTNFGCQSLSWICNTEATEVTHNTLCPILPFCFKNLKGSQKNVLFILQNKMQRRIAITSSYTTPLTSPPWTSDSEADQSDVQSFPTCPVVCTRRLLNASISLFRGHGKNSSLLAWICSDIPASRTSVTIPPLLPLQDF